MGSFGKFYIDVAVTYLNGAATFDEATKNFGRITFFKTAQLLSEAAVEGIGNHGHDYIKVDLDKDR